jgi:hypothetical protein
MRKLRRAGKIGEFVSVFVNEKQVISSVTSIGKIFLTMFLCVNYDETCFLDSDSEMEQD